MRASGAAAMKYRLYLIALALFLVSLLYNLVVWGAMPRLPEVGASIVDSARREAPLATTYIAIGGPLDSALSSAQSFGAQRLTDALGEGFARIHEDPSVAMDLIFNTTWNSAHRWLKTTYWAAPLFLLLTIVLWVLRPRQVRTLGPRR
jgi:hypothetical protein